MKFTSKTSEVVERAKRYSVQNYHPFEVSIEDGEGVWLIDIEGNRFLDCLSCYSAVNFGYRHPKITAAAHAQIDRLPVLPRGGFYSSEASWFYEELAGICPVPKPKVMPLNAGTEAVERGIKFSRRWGYRRKGVRLGEAEVISVVNNFHGRTYGPLSLSSDPDYADFGPFLPGINNKVPFGNIDALDAAITPRTVAVILEPVQGEAGAIVPYVGYLRDARELCYRNKVLLFVDEIQTGFCRTGRFFGCGYEDIYPDGIFLGKALGGGILPVSAVVVSERVADLIGPGDDGSTFGGIPLAAAVGRAAIRVAIEEQMSEKAGEMGKYILEGLRSINSPHVKEIRGRGLLIGIELREFSPEARHFGEKLLELGVAMKDTHKRVLRVAPPLIISKEEADFLLNRVEDVLKK